MPTINQLPLISEASPGDQIPVYQPQNGDARRMPMSALVDFVVKTIGILPISRGGTGGANVETAASNLQGTGTETNSLGFRTVPQNLKSTNYTTVAADSGKHVFTSTGAITLTIASNASVPYPIGTAITFVNTNAGSVTIAINSDTLTLAGSTTTGSRTLAQNGIATALKIDSTSWLISGAGLT